MIFNNTCHYNEKKKPQKKPIQLAWLEVTLFELLHR